MEESRNKTYVADIERGVYDIKDEMRHRFTTGKGLTEEIVRKISKKKDEFSKKNIFLLFSTYAQIAWQMQLHHPSWYIRFLFLDW